MKNPNQPHRKKAKQMRHPLIVPFVLVALLLAACNQTQQPNPDPDPPVLADLLEIGQASADAGDTVTVTYRGVDGLPTVSLGGIEAELVGAPTEGDESVMVVDVVVPAGVAGWASVEVSAGTDRLEIPMSDRAFFVGTVLTSIGDDLQAVQDALDAIDVGSALMIPAGTYTGNEPIGGLRLDNRLLVGSGEDETFVEGVAQFFVFGRSTHTVGIADLTLAADATTFMGGLDMGVLGVPVSPVPVTTSFGRFLMWNATWTGTGAITEPTIDDETLEVTSYGVATGAASRDTSAGQLAFEFDGATIVLNDFNLFDSSAIGGWTIVDSDIWVQDRFVVGQESGNLLVRNSRISQVGDPLTALSGPILEFEADEFDATIVDAVMTATGALRVVTDDGGNRTITGSRFRAEADIVLDGDYGGSMLIEDSWLYANGAIDMDEVADVGTVRIAGSTLDANGRIGVFMDEGGAVEVYDSTLRSRGGDVDLGLSEGTVSVVDSTIEADWGVYIETDDAGNIDIIGSSITTGDEIDFYMDYFGTLTIEGSTLRAGTYLSLDPWSGGSSQIDVRDSLLEAVGYVEISDTDAGDVTIEGSTLRSYCEYVTVDRAPGSIYITDSTLETVGTLADESACGLVGTLNVEIETETGAVNLTGVTIDAQGDVLVEDYDGGSLTPPSFITVVGAADMRIAAGTNIAAGGNVRFGTAGALEVLGSDVVAGLDIVLASPALGDITTTGSTFSPAPTLFTSFP